MVRLSMDAATLWQRYQDWLYYHAGLELYLDVSRMRFDRAFVEAMRAACNPPLADRFYHIQVGGVLRNPQCLGTPKQCIARTYRRIILRRGGFEFHSSAC